MSRKSGDRLTLSEQEGASKLAGLRVRQLLKTFIQYSKFLQVEDGTSCQ